MSSSINPNSHIDVTLNVVTPISGNLNDLSRLEKTRFAAKSYAIHFIYVVDTDSDADFERIRDSISNDDLANVEIIQLNVKAPGMARNAGLERIVEGWTCFWDADDLPHVGEFYEMVKVAEKNSKTICVGGFEIVDSNEKIKEFFPVSQDKDKALIDVGMNPGLWRFCFQRELIGTVKFLDYRMAEDQLFLAEIDFCFDNMLTFTSSVYRYFNDVPGQLTRDPQAINDILETYSEMYLRLRPKKSVLSKMTSLMLARQLLTGLKRLPVVDKLRVTQFALFAIVNSQGLRFQLFNSFYRIYCARKGQQDAAR